MKSINTDEIKTADIKIEYGSRQNIKKVDINSIKEMLIKLIAEKLEIPADEVTPQIGFERIGINSISSSEIISELDEMFDGLMHMHILIMM